MVSSLHDYSTNRSNALNRTNLVPQSLAFSEQNTCLLFFLSLVTHAGLLPYSFNMNKAMMLEIKGLKAFHGNFQ